MKSEFLPKLRTYFLLLLALSVCRPAQNAFAQPSGNITVFADPAASVCFANDTGAGTITLYIVHTNFSGMLSSRFRVTESPGFHATYMNETTTVPIHGGDFRSGIFLGYGECQGGS